MSKKQNRYRRELNRRTKERKKRSLARGREFMFLILKHEGVCRSAGDEYERRHGDRVGCTTCPICFRLCYKEVRKGKVKQQIPQNVTETQKKEYALWWLQYKNTTKEDIVAGII